MKLKNPKDFWSGILFAVMGFAFAAGVKIFDYPMGTSMIMGPGYFPFALGLIMGGIGLIIVGQAIVTSGGPIGKFAWKPLIMVLSAFVIFGLIAKLLGLVIGIVLLVIISAYGGHEFNWKEALVSSVVLTASSVVVFVYGLQLPFPIWPKFLT